MYKLDKPSTKVNLQIRCPSVRVVHDGNQLGVMPVEKARRIAVDAGLDLVEVAPNAAPPVCHIIDFDKFRYQQSQKEKEHKKKQKESSIELKEVRLRPGIQNHDIDTKINVIKRFLSEGNKVLLNLQFKNREITHKDQGFMVVNKIVASLTELCLIESAPRMEGFKLTCRLSPKV